MFILVIWETKSQSLDCWWALNLCALKTEYVNLHRWYVTTPQASISLPNIPTNNTWVFAYHGKAAGRSTPDLVQGTSDKRHWVWIVYICRRPSTIHTSTIQSTSNSWSEIDNYSQYRVFTSLQNTSLRSHLQASRVRVQQIGRTKYHTSFVGLRLCS